MLDNDRIIGVIEEISLLNPALGLSFRTLASNLDYTSNGNNTEGEAKYAEP